MKIGLIGGKEISGLCEDSEIVDIETPYGTVLAKVAELGKHTVFFVKRHGQHSQFPPHKVNYRGNIHAFHNSNVEIIIAVNTVGSLNKKIRPGTIVVPHDFLDFTKSRNYTFYDDQRIHVDMSEPFCPSLRNILIEQGKHSSAVIHPKGVYLVTEGPRLETPAEIQFFSGHCDVVGMTLVPEVVLAREEGICYASLCVTSNMAAGLQKTLTTEDIMETYAQQEKTIAEILESTIQSISKETVKNCNCKKSVDRGQL